MGVSREKINNRYRAILFDDVVLVLVDVDCVIFTWSLLVEF